MAPPGTTSVEVEVYDVGKKIEGIEVVADIMRVQVEQGQLEIMRQFAVQNNSKPPRTQMNEHNLEFYVPDGAQIVEGSAMTEDGNPLNTAPVPEDDKKTKYAFVFPLRPGTTQFEVAYQLPYTGSANIDPKSIYPLQHFVAMLPKSIQFAAAPGANYQVTPERPAAARRQRRSSIRTSLLDSRWPSRSPAKACSKDRPTMLEAQRKAPQRQATIVPAEASARRSMRPRPLQKYRGTSWVDSQCCSREVESLWPRASKPPTRRLVPWERAPPSLIMTKTTRPRKSPPRARSAAAKPVRSRQLRAVPRPCCSKD